MKHDAADVFCPAVTPYFTAQTERRFVNAASSEDPASLPSSALFKLIDTSCFPFDGLFSDAGFVSPAAVRCSTMFICFLSKCEESAEDRCSRTLQQEEELGLDISVSPA